MRIFYCVTYYSGSAELSVKKDLKCGIEIRLPEMRVCFQRSLERPPPLITICLHFTFSAWIKVAIQEPFGLQYFNCVNRFWHCLWSSIHCELDFDLWAAVSRIRCQWLRKQQGLWDTNQRSRRNPGKTFQMFRPINVLLVYGTNFIDDEMPPKDKQIFTSHLLPISV